MRRDDFLENLNDEEMNILMENINEKDFEIDEITKKRIEKKVLGKISNRKRKWNAWKTAGMAAAILLVIGIFNPVVLAYMRELFFVPSVGVVEQANSEMFVIDEAEITQGEEYLASAPTITSDKNGLTLFLSVSSGELSKFSENNITSSDFSLKVNEQEEVKGLSYSSFGSERIHHYRVYFDKNATLGDKVEISAYSNINIKGIMTELESVNVEEIPSTEVFNSNVFAQPFKTETGYDIYMFATSEEYKTESFNTTYPSRDKMYFLTADGKKIDVKPPDGWGSDMMPPMKIEGNPGRGDLVFEDLVYSTADSVTYKYKLPKNKETIAINEIIEYGETPITLEKIYWDELQESYAIDFSWDTNSKPRLLDPIGMLHEGISYATWNPEEGTGTIGLENSKKFLGKREFTLRNPQYIYEEEYRIPLDLE